MLCRGALLVKSEVCMTKSTCVQDNWSRRTGLESIASQGPLWSLVLCCSLQSSDGNVQGSKGAVDFLSFEVKS